MPFYERASDTDASHSVFNEVTGTQTNTNTNSNNSHRKSTTNSNNRTKTTTTNSNNDSSRKQTVTGTARDVSMRSYLAGRDISNSVDNYFGEYVVGDSYYAPIHGSSVGGRNHRISVQNGSKGNISDPDTDLWDEKVRKAKVEEAKLEAELRDIRAKIAAKRAEMRINELTAELAAAKAELAKFAGDAPAEPKP